MSEVSIRSATSNSPGSGILNFLDFVLPIPRVAERVGTCSLPQNADPSLRLIS